MSKNKKLLNESTIRRFMKLASIEPLAESFIEDTEKEDIEEMAYPPGKHDEEELDVEPEEELPVEPEGEFPPVEPEGEVPEAGGPVSQEELVSAVETAVEDIADVLNASFGELTGQTFGVEKGDEEVGLEEPGLDPDLEAPMGPPEEEEEEGLALEGEAEETDEKYTSLDEISSELTKRVLGRILSESKKEKKPSKKKKGLNLDPEAFSDKLVERIFSSLKK